MNELNTAHSTWDPEDAAMWGQPRSKPLLPISEEDLKQMEAAWNDPTFYNSSINELVVTAGYVPKPIVDPNAKLIPTCDQIAELPRWVRVAFAARCARRVRPLTPTDHQKFATEALGAIEQLASVGGDPNEIAFQVLRGVGTSQCSNSSSVQCVWESIKAGQYASDGDVNLVHASHNAARLALASLGEVVTVGTMQHLLGPARDFEHLQRLATREKWTDDTHVPPTVFGPMWEGSPPEWWVDDVLDGRQSADNKVNQLTTVGEPKNSDARRAVEETTHPATS